MYSGDAGGDWSGVFCKEDASRSAASFQNRLPVVVSFEEQSVFGIGGGGGILLSLV
jgi:hypothetical protein